MECSDHHPHLEIILGIREFLQGEWQYSLTHILREGKFIVDALAKKGALQSRPLCLWTTISAFLSLAVLADTTGIQVFRAQSF